MSSVFTLISAPINKEITLGWKKEIFVKFLVSYIAWSLARDFLLELITTDLVTSFQSQKKINYLWNVCFDNSKTGNVFEGWFQIPIWIFLWSFKLSLFDRRGLNWTTNVCLVSPADIGGKIGKNLLKILTQNTSISNRGETRVARSHSKLNIPQ